MVSTFEMLRLLVAAGSGGAAVWAYTMVKSARDDRKGEAYGSISFEDHEIVDAGNGMKTLNIYGYGQVLNLSDIFPSPAERWGLMRAARRNKGKDTALIRRSTDAKQTAMMNMLERAQRGMMNIAGVDAIRSELPVARSPLNYVVVAAPGDDDVVMIRVPRFTEKQLREIAALPKSSFTNSGDERVRLRLRTGKQAAAILFDSGGVEKTGDRAIEIVRVFPHITPVSKETHSKLARLSA